jgi:hypothetical protein
MRTFIHPPWDDDPKTLNILKSYQSSPPLLLPGTFFVMVRSRSRTRIEGGRGVRSFLINKNLCFYYWLRRRVGKRRTLRVISAIEKGVLIFGRESISK